MPVRKNVGKPYEGKPHVRFDEGKLKVKETPKLDALRNQFSTLRWRPEGAK